MVHLLPHIGQLNDGVGANKLVPRSVTSFMLQSPNRLRRPADVERVRQQGDSRRHPLVILLVHPNDLNVSRFAFVASRRVGNAIQRNRAKRLLREAVRNHLPELLQGWDCVLIARPSLPQAQYAEAETAVLQLFKRAKLLIVPEPTETNEGS